MILFIYFLGHLSITDGNYGNVFAVNSTTGALYLTAPLDYEAKSMVRYINFFLLVNNFILITFFHYI